MKNAIKANFKTEIFPIIIIALTLISSFYFYNVFPEKVPVHWNIEGQADSWGSKEFGAFFFPVVIVFIYLLLLFMPNIDPKKDRYKDFSKVYLVFKSILIVFFCLIYFASSLFAIGYDLPISVIVPVSIGIIFIIIGNYMSKIKINWMFGIRTPWTLSSEQVWNKTHRFGGWAFISGGLLIIFSGLGPVILKAYIFVTAIIGIVFGTIVYSYFAYSKENSLKK